MVNLLIKMLMRTRLQSNLYSKKKLRKRNSQENKKEERERKIRRNRRFLTHYLICRMTLLMPKSRGSLLDKRDSRSSKRIEKM